jgi:hypothetical protein
MCADAFTPQEVANLLWGYACLSAFMAGDADWAWGLVQPLLPRCKNQELVNITWAVAQIFPPAWMMDQLCAALRVLAPTFNAQVGAPTRVTGWRARPGFTR